MKKRSFVLLGLGIILAVLLYVSARKSDALSSGPVIVVTIISIAIVSICLLFVFVDFFDYLKMRNSLPPVPYSGEYLVVRESLANALPFAVLKSGGKYFRYDGHLDYTGDDIVYVSVSREMNW